MKIAFCSAVAFGAIGSAGTYKFIEKCCDFFNLRVFAPLKNQNTVFSNSSIPLIPVTNIASRDGIKDIINYLRYFNPDIIYIFNFPHWHKLIFSLKKAFPEKKYILDIKSPLLAEGQKRKKIQEDGKTAYTDLDAIVTLSEHNVPTWIPECTITPMIYPLGIDYALFNNFSCVNRKNCRKFVYIGVLHKQRQLDLLIEIFSEFVKKTDTEVSLDFYGTGPDHERLENLVYSLSMEDSIRFHGLHSQNELIKMLPKYDAGIAWVPYKEYNTSPSLKAIEYMAAGIPILASDTKAHIQLENEGCTVEFFQNTSLSLIKALEKMYKKGFSVNRIQQNLEAVKQYDYNQIILNYFSSFFHELFDNKTDEQLKNNTEDIVFKKSQRILYIGPLFFKPGIWETRVSYILPDLFDAVPEEFEIYMLTGKVREFARKSLKDFCKQYGITHLEAHSRPEKITSYEYWKTEIAFAADKIRPDVITNIWAPVILGSVMGLAGRRIGARIVLRVAGDEIESRISMGSYDKNMLSLDVDMAHQTLGIEMADTIIVMSPQEKERICKYLPESQWDKVIVCIRGIDTSKFSRINRNYLKKKIKRFLYVGRKSLEKGYDILEEVADKSFDENQDIQFVFAGSFEPLKIKNQDYIGWVDSNDLHKIFSRSDAFIMTSRAEGFPQAAAEALATGLPCILPEHIFKNILENNKQAILTSLSSKDILKAVFLLNENKKLASTVSKGARAFAEAKLDKKIWSKIYHDILSGKEKFDDHPFLLPKTKKNETVPENTEREQMKIILFVSLSMLSFGKARHKLNRFCIEMAKRKHLVYLVFPEKEHLSFYTSEKIVFSPYRFFKAVKDQIQKLAPDLLMIAVNDNKDRIKFSSVAYGTGIPVVFLEILYANVHNAQTKDQPCFDTAFDLWEKEIALSSAVLILTDQKEYLNNLPKYVNKQLYVYPERTFPVNGLTLQYWQETNNEIFNHIEMQLLKASEYKNEPEQVFWEQMKLEPEKALHARRMREKNIQSI